MRNKFFRAWNKEKQKMYYSNTLLPGYIWFTFESGQPCCLLQNPDEDRPDEWKPLDNIMQNLGKTDIRGKEMYEGDIVRQFADCDENGNDLFYWYLIRWNNDNMCFEGVTITEQGIDETDIYVGSDLQDLEIMGNMYENPDMLQGEGISSYSINPYEGSCLMCGIKEKRINVTLYTKQGTYTYCPNCTILNMLRHSFPFEFVGDYTCDITGSKDAVKYESDKEEYFLSKECLERLILRNLKKDEYFTLAKKYGAQSYMIHEDFYDPETGFAYQPTIS